MKNSKNKSDIINFGTLNVCGCQNSYEKETLANDAANFKIDVLGVSETHLKTTETELEQISVSIDNKIIDYLFYYCGNNTHHGVGILIRKELNPSFNKISDRICTSTFSLGGRKVHVITAYAPTLSVSQKHPNICEDFYNQLDRTISDVPKRNICVILGDFNAKTGTGHLSHPEHIGKFGKGVLNNNGEILLEHLVKHDLYITNTTFQHKMCHRTTWTAPFRNFTAYDGNPRRNPVRNQIDYIITRREHRPFIQDSRSYGGTQTNTDHKMVKMVMKIEWYKLKQKKPKKEAKIDIKAFSDRERREKYKVNVKEKYLEAKRKSENTNSSPQEKWNKIVEISKKAGKEELGLKEKPWKYNDEELENLSKQQFQIKEQMEANPSKSTELRKQRKEVKKKINKIIKKLEEREIDSRLRKIESMKDDSNKTHQAVRELKNMKPVKPLKILNEENQIVGGIEEQIRIIQDHFQMMLAPDNINAVESYPPMKMKEPFTGTEIKKAANSMANGKSAGIDQLSPEFIKYSPDCIHEEIAEILNITAETGEYPMEIRTGILRPLPKPGKKQGPVSNLRPIILLSVLRKIIAVSLISRAWNRLKDEIPADQAAYQPGRSTTEQVFSVKILAEKAITSSDFTIYLLLLDMSKAFDTVNRNKLLKDLSNVLDRDELHLLHLLINNVNIHVKIENNISENPIETKVGICQGDCLSAIMFIFYLAKSICNTNNRFDHNYCLPPAAEPSRSPIMNEHNYAIYRPPKQNFTIEPKYADDITWATTSIEVINTIKNTIPPKLTQRELKINEDKTEEFIITKNNNEWKDCKLLGSKLDTAKDIERRKALTINTMKQLKPLFKNHRMNEKLKLRTFQAYVNSIFLYNSELWTITNKTAHSIDAFHRRQLRYALNIIWPNKISSENLYKRTKMEPWSEVIQRRRLTWLGHLLRLPHETPAQLALNEAIKPSRKYRGRPPITWLDTIKKDLTELNILPKNLTYNDIIKHLRELTENRVAWKKTVGSAISEQQRKRR